MENKPNLLLCVLTVTCYEISSILHCTKQKGNKFFQLVKEVSMPASIPTFLKHVKSFGNFSIACQPKKFFCLSCKNILYSHFLWMHVFWVTRNNTFLSALLCRIKIFFLFAETMLIVMWCFNLQRSEIVRMRMSVLPESNWITTWWGFHDTKKMFWIWIFKKNYNGINHQNFCKYEW